MAVFTQERKNWAFTTIDQYYAQRIAKTGMACRVIHSTISPDCAWLSIGRPFKPLNQEALCAILVVYSLSRAGARFVLLRAGAMKYMQILIWLRARRGAGC